MAPQIWYIFSEPFEIFIKVYFHLHGIQICEKLHQQEENGIV